VLRPPVSYEIVAEIFILLNSKGRKANDHEQRRFKYRGNGINLLRKCTELPIFKKVTGDGRRFQRGKDEELVLRYFALYIWLNIQKIEFEGINHLLNQTILYINDNIDIGFRLLDDFKSGLEKTIDTLGVDCFSIEKGVPYALNSGLFETICNIASFENVSSNELFQIVMEIKKDNDFIDRVHKNTRSNIIYRYKFVEHIKNHQNATKTTSEKFQVL